VPGDARRVPTLEAMSRDVDALYARFGLPPPDTADPAAANDALAPLFAANLDGFAFRKELVKLTGELGEASARLAESQQWSEQLERNAKAWAAKLEADITELKREIARLGEENRVLAEQKAALNLLPQRIQTYLLRVIRRARP
jgi:septal ring factor EnvC (AmiA/AmiB activator)